MSKIEWTQRTWNPVTGCNKVSQGCKNCYAEVMHKRLMGMYPGKYSKPFNEGVELHEDELMKPYSWKPSLIFVNSMSDLFHDDVPFDFIKRVFSVIHEKRTHTFQILTKRAKRMYDFFEWLDNSDVMVNFPNLWIGVSVEDQQTANERIPFLVASRAGHKFLSIEPLLGPIDLASTIYPTFVDRMKFLGFLKNEIGWVIVGGESGHKARPMDPDWVAQLKSQCEIINVPFFFKQWGEWMPSFLIPYGLDLMLLAKKPRIKLLGCLY
jgi:protein gp37